MVLTRSADKRLDTTRDEDLVLRSRKISSPASSNTTPTQARKRQTQSRENGGSPRTKRPRFETDESNGDGDFHVVVDVPVKSGNIKQAPSSQVSEQVTNSRTDAATSTNTDTTDANHKDQVTPQSKVVLTSETPDPGSEMFKTPATSRHKRFDSEETEEDTIVVSANIDSSAPQGYQTAEEQISDSDDNDAPEVETTRARKASSQPNSTRTPRSKKRKVRPQPTTYSEDEETIEVAPIVVGEFSKAVVAQPLSVEPDPTHPATGPSETEDEKSIVDSKGSLESLQPQVPEALDPRILVKHPDLPFTFDNNDSVSPAKPKDASLNAVQDLSNPMRDLSTGKFPMGVSGVVHGGVRLREFGQEEFDTDRTNLAGLVQTVRLPAKSASTLTGYRRNQLQQREVRSGGGFRMQSNWPKKRTTFVNS